MSYLFFEDVIEELGHRLTYEAICGYTGNAFMKDSWKMVMENNPFSAKRKGTNNGFAEFIKSANIKILKKEKVNGKENHEQGRAGEQPV